MALSFASSGRISNISTSQSIACNNRTRSHRAITVRCETANEQPQPQPQPPKLEVGSPIVIVEAPKVIKTAASMPCLRANSGLVKPGDVGRIVSRKPKDVWAVRLSIGTYLLDGKYFRALELEG